MGLGCLAMAGGGATGLAPLVQAYRGGIRNASPTAGVVHNRVSVSTVAICGESRKKVQERSAELIDWYRHQQALRDVRVWGEQDPSRVPEDYQWHYTRSTATDSPKREETSSLDQIRSRRYCIGDPDDCVRYLEAYAEAGVDEVMPLFRWAAYPMRKLWIRCVSSASTSSPTSMRRQVSPPAVLQDRWPHFLP